MVTKSAPKKSSTKRTVKSSAKKTTKRAAQARAEKVDYYPNRMTVAISTLAGTILVLLAIITVLGSRS